MDRSPVSVTFVTADYPASAYGIVRVGETARERETAVVLMIDKLQYVAEDQLAALIGALHGANQLRLPVTLVGAGLPQLLSRMARARSYAERRFEFVSLGLLDEAAATAAIRVPVEREKGASHRERWPPSLRMRCIIPVSCRNGQAKLENGRCMADHGSRCRYGPCGCAGRTRRRLLLRTRRTADTSRETVSMRHDGARCHQWRRPVTA